MTDHTVRLSQLGYLAEFDLMARTYHVFSELGHVRIVGDFLDVCSDADIREICGGPPSVAQLMELREGQIADIRDAILTVAAKYDD